MGAAKLEMVLGKGSSLCGEGEYGSICLAFSSYRNRNPGAQEQGGDGTHDQRVRERGWLCTQTLIDYYLARARGGVGLITCDSCYVEKVLTGIDTVVLAAGLRPFLPMRPEQFGPKAEVHVLGDALRPQTVFEAIHSAAEVAYGL